MSPVIHIRCVCLLLVLPWTPAAWCADIPELQEIKVTAGLRQQALSTLPRSATVLGGRDLAQAGVQHLEELLPQLPSLSWAGASSRPRYFQLRGIGELEQYQGAPNPSVGFLVDEVDFSGIGMVASLFDVEQVEVLRGPQGTRFGANALAGLIKVKTRDPRDERELGAEFSAGDDDLWSAGMIAGDGFTAGAWRVAAQRSVSNGFRRNPTLGRDDTNGRDERTFRAKLALGAGGPWQALLSLSVLDFSNGYDAFALDNSLVTLSDRPGRDSQVSRALVLDLRHQQQSGTEFRSITSWSDSDMDSSFDGDWGSALSWGARGPYDFYSRNLRTRQVATQDLRWSSTAGAATGWILGAYGQRLDEDNQFAEDGRYLADSFLRLLDSHYQSDTAALYGQVEQALGQHDALILGVRGEQRRMRYADTQAERYAPRERLWGGEISYRHDFSADSAAWLSLSRGTKAGGFNLGAAVPQAHRAFGPEYLWSLQGGYRAQWRDRGISTDISGFFMRREHQQVATSVQIDPQDPLTFLYLTENAARGEAFGLEASARWQVWSPLAVSSSLSLMQSRYISYQFGERSLHGREWAHAPGWKASLSADWRHATGWAARVDLSGQDGFFHDTSHDQRQGAYVLANLRLGYEAPRWSVHAWVHNALDRRYAVRGFFFGNEPPDFAERLYVRLGDPRQLGITVRINY